MRYILWLFYLCKTCFVMNRSLVKCTNRLLPTPPFPMTFFVCYQIVFCYLAVLIFPTPFWLIFNNPNEGRHKVIAEREIQLFNPFLLQCFTLMLEACFALVKLFVRSLVPCPCKSINEVNITCCCLEFRESEFLLLLVHRDPLLLNNSAFLLHCLF